MASDRAEQTAHDIIKNLRKPTMTKGKILKRNGYAESVQKHPNIVTETKSYQRVARPFLKRLEGLRDKIITEMESKDITHERFTELGRTLQGITHDIQLISGNATENIHVAPIYDGTSAKTIQNTGHDSNAKDISNEKTNPGSGGRNSGIKDSEYPNMVD